MNQYKLIKEYPGSPKLGTIHWFKIDEFGPSSNNIWQGTNFYDAHPTFWQKVEEVDYEIISYVTDIANPQSKLQIYSVKRLSDSEVFTIGDKCKYIDEIGTFKLIDGKILVNGKKASDFLNYIKRDKTPLFTTEDGVEIFKGDSYYLVSKDFCIGFCSFYSKSDLTYKLFSTKEKAEEYILQNKPCLSLNDLLSVWGNSVYPEMSPLFLKFEKLAKSKL